MGIDGSLCGTNIQNILCQDRYPVIPVPSTWEQHLYPTNPRPEVQNMEATLRRCLPSLWNGTFACVPKVALFLEICMVLGDNMRGAGEKEG